MWWGTGWLAPVTQTLVVNESATPSLDDDDASDVRTDGNEGYNKLQVDATVGILDDDEA